MTKNHEERNAHILARVEKNKVEHKDFIAWRSTEEDRAIIARILATYPDLENVVSRAIRKALRCWDEQNRTATND